MDCLPTTVVLLLIWLTGLASIPFWIVLVPMIVEVGMVLGSLLIILGMSIWSQLGDRHGK